MRRLGPAALAAGLALSGCGGGDDGAARTTVGVPTSVPVAATSSAAAGTVATPSSTGDAPDTTTTIPPGTALEVPQGFDAVAVRVLDPLQEWCLWLAATADERARGLMGVTALGGADGMLFDFGGISTGEFWMYQTLLPLSIAFFDESGEFVSSTDMDPCTTANSAECPRYGATGPYSYAIEVAKGDLPRLGLVAGSRIELGDACAPG